MAPRQILSESGVFGIRLGIIDRSRCVMSYADDDGSRSDRLLSLETQLGCLIVSDLRFNWGRMPLHHEW